MFDFPERDFAMHYHNWGKKYNSDILHASALGSHVFILNSLEDAEELLERGASNYSDRIELPILKLLGYDTNMAFMHHGTTWRQHRKVAQKNFRLDTMSAHHPIQSRRIHLMLKGLLDDPDRAFTHHEVLSVSIPLELMYGYDVRSLDDPFITQARKAIELSRNFFNPAPTLINFIPALGKIPPWVPGATTQKVAEQVRKIVHNMETEPMEMVKKAMNDGTANPSVFSEFLEAKHSRAGLENEEDIVRQVALTIYSGASDTIICALGSLLYLLATRPDIQKKGQEEIDRVVGMDRLPEFSDRESLPEDDTYKGYYIPKGSTIFPNIWAMARDENLFPEPNEFKPKRFIDEHGQLIPDSHVLTYGFGRRICIGRYSASSTLWFTIASLLACFDIGKAKDDQGNDVEISDDFLYDTIVSVKTPFKCAITPPSQAVRRLVEEAVTAEKLH
ncbi:cytochrome P450 [Pholiota conissans]|uniref:Cytochrome P450 n=1 Tax=Pholiota conissans TaxID=109636 RepID=A0A9P5YWT9_9AGAR|nr:cytochrome P450 [Pholiota conissans]